MTTTPAQPEPPILPPFEGEITPLIRSLARALNIESIDAAVGEGDLHLAARLAQHMAQPEPSEREALARAMYEAGWAARHGMVAWDASPIHIRSLFLDRADAALAWFATRPAPVVSAEAVEKAAEALDVEHFTGDGCGDPRSPGSCSNCFGGRPSGREVLGRVLAALGLTVTDTPAADDEEALEAEVARLTARADAAEAVIERVRELATKWERRPRLQSTAGAMALALRAALSDAAPQPRCSRCDFDCIESGCSTPDAAPQVVEDRQPYDGPTMRLIEAGHDLSLAPHYLGPGKWCGACPIPQPLSDATDGREGT